MNTIGRRTVLTLDLVPIAGSRFQPTGFPDLGAATFERVGAEGEQLLVESVQSMANHLEATTWDAAAEQPVAEVAALPYIRVVGSDGGFLTSSRLEAHRVASAYVLDSTLDGKPARDVLRERFGLAEGKPLNMRKVAAALFALDPVSLIHGVFFAQKWPWQPKIARAMSVFIEASDVRPAVSGGVKRDSVHNEADKSSGRTSDQGYGMVPHHRVEYSAASIRLYSVIDEQQLASYGLSDTATEVLSALAEWELATLLDNGLRLRTACDLVVSESNDGTGPAVDAASERLASAIASAREEFAEPTEGVWTKSGKGKAAPIVEAD